MTSTIQGAKGGGSQRTPVESPDSLRSIAYFRILDLVSEGEIGGLVNGLQSIYLDETPLANPDGSLNFQNVHVETRTGTQDQEEVPGYPAVENEINVGVELKQSTPWIRSLSNTSLSAVRVTIGVPGLSKANTSNGDINGYSVQYKIEVQTDSGAWQLAYTGAITGKTTSKYQRSHRIDLPAAQNGWNVRVTRITANANSSSIADITTIDSYTEVIDGKLRYPNSALLGISGDAAQFSNIPSRAYDLWGRILQVPSNYDPLARTYSGVWDGSFKPAWTDNPAWIYYDLATHPRYGLGHLITAAQVNKWELYRIAQYCDQAVSDGKGGTEPRFTCNVFLQTASDAYKLLSDLASVFRGISFWTGGAITASADMPADPVYAYSAANVIGGQFTYAASTRKTRYTTALVTWNDPSDFYRAKVEYVEDRTGLARYGIQQTTLTAFGCTSQAQAQRAGQWVLLTSRLETDTVTFKVGLDGTIAAPGQIVRITDPARAGKRQGGRVHQATRTVVTVDKAPEQVAVGDRLTVMLSTGVSETQAITAIDGVQLTVAAPGFSVQPETEAVWVVESDTLAAQTYRVLSVIEDKSSSDISYTITALQHVPGKFAAIDNGAIIQIPPISSLPASTQAPPANVQLNGHVVITQGIATNVVTIAWGAAAGATSYQVEWRRNDGEWVSAGRTSGLSVDVEGIYTGTYIARVRAVSPGGVVSLPALSAATDVLGKTGAPPVVAALKATSKVWGIHLEWSFPAGTDDTQRTEVWRSTTPNLQDATKMADLAYPQNSLDIDGLAAGVSFYFWVRLVDKTGNIGAFYPNGTGLPAQSSSSQADYEPVIAGLIGQTELGQQILEGVDLATSDMAGDAGEWAGDNGHFAGTWTLLDAVQDGDRSMAKRVDLVQATVDNTSAAVQQTSQAVVDLNGKVSATWTVKCQVSSDGRIYGAGMGLGVEQQPDGSYQSQALFQADRFAVINTANNNVTAPFVIQNGQTYIRQALIGDGWINNAMIGDYIQSTDYVANQRGWKISKSGNSFELNGSGGGGRLLITNTLVQVFDGNGVMRVRLGIW
ncbi:host specificity protein J [Dyella sp. LX-66]|uniref:host specificity protein J n=1 Tax=unclassified Dyella TaxID=2634549 RepID=UPI001BDF8B35|nr:MULTISPECIES: host specificity protein J [unclassified Dyella]MBT2116414.1 host specificity protein J [Dyella sp. LX-1]MBT2140643.1 host specificity protein J [Dyella sp. LX-66]